jgi:flagellar hook-associated protein 2
MADGLQVGGLASGLDTTSIINGLMSIENQKVTREEDKKSEIELKLSTFNDLKTKLTDFYAKAKDMDSTTALNVFKSSSSDETIAKISGADGASVGNFDLEVQGLASSLKIASKSFTNTQATNSLGFTGSFKISVSAASLKADSSVTDVTLDLDGSETLKDIATKINRAKGTGATASVVKMGTDDYRLMITAVDEGTKGFTLKPVAGDEAKGLFSDGLDLINEAVVGTAGKSSIRTDFDLKLATGGPATATTTFAQLFNGLGTGKAITAGDTITINGTNAAGAAIAPITYTIGAATDTLQTLLTTGDAGGNSIKSAFGNNVNVSMNSSGEIVMTDTTGGTSPMTLTLAFADTNATGSTLSMGTSAARTDFKSVISEGKKAFYLMNDIAFSSQTNRDDTTVSGTVFELKSVSTKEIKLTLDYDKDGIKKKVQDYLDTYNQLLKFLDEKSKIEVKQADNSKAQSATNKKTTIVKGPFAGDSSILGLKSQLQAMMTNKIPEITDNNLGKYSSLAAIGITSEQKTGFLVINDTTFNASLDADFEGIKRIFVTNGYTTNAAHTFGTYTKDTKTGVYDIDPSAGAPKFDTDKGTGTSWATATVSGDGDVLNSDSGDSKGMAVKANSASGVGKVVFIRGVAGQVRDFYDKINNFVDGFMTTTVKNYNDRIKDEETKISRLETQVAGVKERLTQQFANLELSISKLQSQSAAFNGQLKR